MSYVSNRAGDDRIKMGYENRRPRGRRGRDRAYVWGGDALRVMRRGLDRSKPETVSCVVDKGAEVEPLTRSSVSGSVEGILLHRLW